MMKNITLPEPVKNIIKDLNRDGFGAFVVGGCVRDSIMGIEPKDWDICTSATPEQIVSSLFAWKVIPTGEQYGTFTVLVDGIGYEVTSYRTVGAYSDGMRQDINTRFGDSLRDDLSCRDITINAIAYNDKSGFLDPFGGISDIKAGIIRAVGNPEDRIREDAIRIIRALRFANRFGFRIDPELSKAILENMWMIANTSVERYRSEFIKILESDTVSENLMNLVLDASKSFGIRINPNVVDWQRVNNSDGWYLRFLVIMAYQNYTSDELEFVLRQVKFDNRTVTRTVKIIESIQFGNYPISVPSMKRFLNRYGESITRDSIILREVSGLPFSKMESMYNSVLLSGEPWKISMLAIDGDDLINMGIPAGIQIGTILNSLLDCVIDNPSLNNPVSLLGIAKNIK